MSAKQLIFFFLGLSVFHPLADAQKRSPHDEILSDISAAMHADQRRTRNYGAYMLASMMMRSGMDADVATSFLLAYLEDGLEVRLPDGWKRLVFERFRHGRNMPRTYHDPNESSSYRYLADSIVGPEGKFPAPKEFGVRDSPLFATVSDSFLAVVGIRETGLSELLIYEKGSHKLVGTHRLYFREKELSGRPADRVTTDAVVYVIGSRENNRFVLFCFVGSSFSIEFASDMDHFVYFCSDDIAMLMKLKESKRADVQNDN